MLKLIIAVIVGALLGIGGFIGWCINYIVKEIEKHEGVL